MRNKDCENALDIQTKIIDLRIKLGAAEIEHGDDVETLRKIRQYFESRIAELEKEFEEL